MRNFARELQKKVIQILTAKRIEKKLSQETIAKEARISRTALGFIEKGKRNPTLVTCLLIAKALNTKLCDAILSAEKSLENNHKNSSSNNNHRDKSD